MARPSKSGFTLVELLAVIAIIGILAGVMLTGVMKAREYAWRASARHSCHQIVSAWQAYMLDNKAFPSNIVVAMDATTLAVLNKPTRYNQKTAYLEVSDTERLNGLRDRWGGLYQVALDNGKGDHDQSNPYDGKVTAGKHGEIQKSVAAWSLGPDGEDGTEDDALSW